MTLVEGVKLAQTRQTCWRGRASARPIGPNEIGGFSPWGETPSAAEAAGTVTVYGAAEAAPLRDDGEEMYIENTHLDDGGEMDIGTPISGQSGQTSGSTQIWDMEPCPLSS